MNDLKRYNEYSKEYVTNIPLLQRDYVQGSDKNAEKRDKFLTYLFDSLAKLPDSSGKIPSGQLDFIYGSSGSLDNEEGRVKEFYPIDGQQRLTTIALIGWLLDRKSPVKDGEIRVLPDIRYISRFASEQFCGLLMDYDLPENYGNIRNHLLTHPMWMAERWKYDPSVMAMLDLLAKADEMLESETYKDKIDDMAKAFFHESPLKFECLDMEKYGLNDDLYIKMNARGKHLSKFENWKAEFIDVLTSNFKDVNYTGRLINGVAYTIPEYFSHSIEHDWCDLLWPKAFKAWDDLGDEKKLLQPYPRIDEAFMRIFDFITEALFWIQYPESVAYSKKPTEKEVENKVKLEEKYAGVSGEWLHSRYLDMYKNHLTNVETLFRLFDTLCDISKANGGKWESFFDELLYSGAWQYNSEKINLFDNSILGVDLFSRLTENKDFTLPVKMLMWSMLNYCNKYGVTSPLPELLDFIRVIWGWELNIKQRLGRGELIVRGNIRIDGYQDLDKVLSVLLKDSQVDKAIQSISEDDDSILKLLKEELKKYHLRKEGFTRDINRLFGCELLRGDISNLVESMKELKESGAPAGEFVNRFKAFYDLADSDKIRRLVSYGWKGLNDIYPNYYFYGNKDHWTYIFSASKPSLSPYLKDMIAMSPLVNLSPLKKEYYINKYPDFIDAHRWDEGISHLFLANNDFVISVLGDRYTFSQLWYQECPYAYTVAKILNRNNKDLVEKLKLIDSRESDHGRLRFNRYNDEYKYFLECVENGWFMGFKDSIKWKENWKERFEIDDEGIWKDRENEFIFTKASAGSYACILKDSPGKDRVETVIDFLKTLYALI